MRRLRRSLYAGAAGAAVLALAVVGAPPLAQNAGASPARGVTMHPMVIADGAYHKPAPPAVTTCLSAFDIRCYGAPQIEDAYNVAPLYRFGINGSGETIVIVDSFGAPTIKPDLAYFDKEYGLPAPPQFKILKYGTVPVYTPSTPTATGWAIETSLDVEYSHAMAPGANILLVETATAETLGRTGFPTIVNAENYVINHHMGDVITQSFGAPEPTFASAQTVRSLRSAYRNAERNGITVLAAAGDAGASGVANITETKFFPYQVVDWPAIDPLVTGVGGTQLTLSQTGKRLAPDTVWNDTALFGGPAAGGGGVSSIFARPTYQNGVAAVVGKHRGMPDVAMSASVSGCVLVYMSGIAYVGGKTHAAWGLIGGTSEASPEFSGVVAMADQLAHHSLGLINPALYLMGSVHALGLEDITTGNNSVFFITPTTGKRITVPGYAAGQGYDLASGLGTVNAAEFVPSLVVASAVASHGGFAYQAQPNTTMT